MMLHHLRRGAGVTFVQQSSRRPATMQSKNRNLHVNSSSSSKRMDSTASFFLNAKAACKGKRCGLGNNYSGIGSNPSSCGEDSFFLTHDVMGVADGVGGWNENGVDPGKISRSLMRNAAEFVRHKTVNNTSASTQEVLAHSYKQALEDDDVEAGSTTACIVRLKQSKDGQPVLEYSNLGDSGFVIIRNNNIIFRSEFQYYGRAPYQLAKIPMRFKQYGAIETPPDNAASGEINVQAGDLVVLATDGVWDNFAPDLQKVSAQSPAVLSWRRCWSGELASLVDVIAQDVDKAAENIVLASLRHNLKPDDITVVVAKVATMGSKL
ncbi:hypothetical protein PsorP6_002475 [Peronosclerospora sorghi]|uniref:Uncharacterized protein n=1 Tax=Peronosclerospora sorghi TaxID=230839 RepID=A0ACC0WUQ5_9STRA|nr:hypothetical protein PsorP6_002475 [Peronosclerospora sorghi]